MESDLKAQKLKKDLDNFRKKLREGEWRPENKAFIERFNQYIRKALVHLAYRRNMNLINNLVADTPDYNARNKVIEQLEKELLIKKVIPNNIGEAPRLKIDKSRWNKKKNKTGPFDEKTIEKMKSFPVNGFKFSLVESNESRIKVDKGEFTKEEFIDWVLDGLTLFRSDFELSEIKELQSTLERVSNRIKEE